MNSRFVRIAEQERRSIELDIDGVHCTALEGDTLLVAVLTQTLAVRQSEFGDGPRAGFCLMGACQDCWMWTARGERIRACTTMVASGMSVLTRPPAETLWPAAQ